MEGRYKLKKALMIYEGDGDHFNHDRYYVEIHNVSISHDGKPVFLTGRSLTQKSMMAISGMFSGTAVKQALTGFLPSNLLSVKETAYEKALLWHSPPQERYLHFSGSEELSGMANCPALLFLVVNDKLYVYALKAKRRPTPRTKVFVAPFPNIYQEGNVCMGNTKIPADMGTVSERMETWERLFFGSAFTTAPTLWKEQIATGKPFPNGKLDSHHQFKTVETIIEHFNL